MESTQTNIARDYCLFRTKLTPYSGEIDPPFRVIDPLTVLGKRLPFRRN